MEETKTPFHLRSFALSQHYLHYGERCLGPDPVALFEKLVVQREPFDDVRGNTNRAQLHLTFLAGWRGICGSLSLLHLTGFLAQIGLAPSHVHKHHWLSVTFDFI
jgi:hypothetical protein